jgi:hypothetical protein
VRKKKKKMLRCLPTKELRPSHVLWLLFIAGDGKHIGARAMPLQMSEGGHDMKIHFTVTKIIANLPENVKY